MAGGAPKKFVTGALAEGEIAAEAVLSDLDRLSATAEEAVRAQEQDILNGYEQHLRPVREQRYSIPQVEEAMQKIMDNYAGGIGTDYRYNEAQLRLADERIASLIPLADTLRGEDMDDLLHIFEIKDRLTVCRSLIAHLRDRKETRWPGFGIHTDHPDESGDWKFYVNSRLEDGEIRIIHRDLVEGGLSFEHLN